MKSTKSGFMLIELIIVLFLIVLIIGLSTVFIANTFPPSKFNAFVRDISSNIRYAKNLALIKGEDQFFYIDFESRKYGIKDFPEKFFPININIKIEDPFSGEVSKGTYYIFFYSMGGLSGGNILVYDNKRAVRIYLDPVVGSVVVK
ncbi:MAG: hypothetical protein N3A59_00600 [Thermodesulfovibrionales bacterium]|nr:hypothetical protein [Thermodesulfovibrionales bacterium]